MRLLILALSFLAPFAVKAELHFHGGWEVCQCKGRLHENAGAATDANAGGKDRRYAPNREIDLKHLRLELSPDFEERSVSGTATYTFAPIAMPLSRLRLDAVDLEILDIDSPVALRGHEVGKSEIVLTFAEPIPPGAETNLSLRFRAHPQDGWFFRTEAMGYPAGDDHFWTQGQPERHRHWFPCYDSPNERFTSEVICRVPRGMTVVSNGRLAEERDEGEETVFHWKQEKEHVNYLISVVGGHFQKLEGKHGDLPLAFLTPPSEFAAAENSFRDTAQILEFFESEIGVAYPWDKYYSVCVADFVAGGMENTSVTTLTTNTLFSAESENLRTSHRLDAHEIAHQWFGNLVTCKDWSHLWLNEGFATYYTHLYDGHKFGLDEMRYRLLLDAKSLVENKDEKPIVWRGYRNPMEQFDYRAYPKGSWVLHMLRSQLGADLYREAIRSYLERHRNGNVVTGDLLAVVEEVSGRSYDEFFDQWVHHGGTPALGIVYVWDEARGLAKLTVRQNQKTSERVLLFSLPLPVRFVDEEGRGHDFTIEVRKAHEDFHFALPKKPRIVRIDPEVTVLAKIDFTPPNPLLHAQLENGEDPIGRLLAAETLGDRRDRDSLDRLGRLLREDAFHGVRIAAAKALAKTRTPEALAILLEARDQGDARVRREVLAGIAKSYSQSALAALRDQLGKERNPDLVADLLAAAGKYPAVEVRPLLLESLGRDSFRNVVASAAIRGLAASPDPSLAAPLREHLAGRDGHHPTEQFGRALEALAKVSRELKEEPREEIRLFLLGYLEDPREGLRRAAVSALGILGDTRSLGALRSFADSGRPDLPDTKAAEEAVKKLSGEKPQSAEVEDLRREMLEARKQLDSLREELESLKKRNEASAQ